MTKAKKPTKNDLFVADMIRCRGIDFARIGMMIEVSGDVGTICGMNSSCNLDVEFANTLKHGKGKHNCHPFWNTKFFDASGQVIAHYNQGQCVFRPERKTAPSTTNA